MSLGSKQEKQSYFMLLPDELQIKIFSELSINELLKSTMVCSKWNMLIYDGSLWSHINCTSFYKKATAEFIIKLIKASSKFLKVANFRGCIQLTGHGLRTLSQNCPNVQVLILKDCKNLSSASIQYMIQHTKELQKLDMSCLDTVKPSTFSANNCHFSQLEKLNLSWCKNMTGPGLLPIFASCSQSLRYLNLNGCRQLDDDIMAAMGTQLTQLTHLSLISCHSVTDTGLLNFVKNSSSQLTHMNLSNCTRLTDTALRYLANYATSITHLDLAGCVLMTDEGIQQLSSRLVLLTHLDLEDLHHLTNASIASIAQYQTKLQRLCLSNCVHVSDDAITHLILQGRCRQLQHIELDNCSITDVVLDTIANYFLKNKDSEERKLHIEVLDCSHVTETGVKDALHKASPKLSIKSFYSFQYNTTTDESDSIQHQFQSSRYTTVSSSRGRRGRTTSNNHGIQQNEVATSCIIL